MFLVFVSEESEAATFTVDKFGGSDYTNITQAVDSAGADDTIRVASRTYHDAVDVDKTLTIIGGQYGTDIGDIYDCDNGDLVAIYDFDENGGSDANDGVWCEDLDLDGDISGASWATGVWESALDLLSRLFALPEAHNITKSFVDVSESTVIELKVSSFTSDNND